MSPYGQPAVVCSSHITSSTPLETQRFQGGSFFGEFVFVSGQIVTYLFPVSFILPCRAQYYRLRAVPYGYVRRGIKRQGAWAPCTVYFKSHDALSTSRGGSGPKIQWPVLPSRQTWPSKRPAVPSPAPRKSPAGNSCRCGISTWTAAKPPW